MNRMNKIKNAVDRINSRCDEADETVNFKTSFSPVSGEIKKDESK